MNDTPDNRQNSDLPRPRQFPEDAYDYYREQLPPLKRTEKPERSSVPVHTQEFKIPKRAKTSDEFQTQEIEIPSAPEYSESEQDFSSEEDFDYGAYEEYDRPKNGNSSHKKQHKSTNPENSRKNKKSNAHHANAPQKQTSQTHSKKSSKKTHSHSFGGGFLKNIIRHILFLAVVIFAIYSAIAFLLIRQLEKLPEGTRSVTSGTLDAGYVRSVLLIGTDARDVGSERGRSDTMILLSLNSRTQTIYLTSFMRDAYVDIPNHGYNKLNAAYSLGGAELLMDTLEQNYQVSIDDYCVVSFMGFASIIDAFGGVKINLSDAEAQALNVILQSEVNGLAGDDPLSDFIEKGGTYILNGKQALSYARIRYVGNADFERTSRQREVMTQLLQNAKSKAVTAVPELISSAMPHLGTNMSDTELYFLSLRVPFALRYDIAQIQIPADGTYTPADIDGQSVLQVDFNANIQVLKDSVYSAPAVTTAE
ncbi:MAG: LCP family protein [Oscillospiraceae bacterium]|nr:LCP family protein [Oscillospiraceae bacterium]